MKDRPHPYKDSNRPPAVSVSYSTEYYKRVTIAVLAIPPVQDHRIEGQKIVPNDCILCPS